MPNVPLNPNEKQAFIALVQAAPYPGGAFEADRLETVLVYYSDVFTAIMRQLELFASNNAYLTQAIGVFDDTELQAVGIWNNKTISSPPLTDPVLIINSTITDLIVISPISPPQYQTLAILGTSRISRIVLLDYTDLNELYIGPSVVVDVVDSSYSGAIINIIWLPFIKSVGATLNAAVYESQIQTIAKEEGSYFGGFTNDDPESTCETPVTDLDAQMITQNSVILSWVPPSQQSPPADYLFINIFYKKSESSVWIPVDEFTGDFVGETGFAFRHLEKDTWYDFRVVVTCLNGGIANADLIDSTVCCGNPAAKEDATQEFTAEGDTAFSVGAAKELHSIGVFPDGTETIRIGTTPGGDELLTDTSITTDGLPVLINQTFSLTLQTSIYISGAVGLVNYRVIEL